jgi:hypothetical protein
LSKNEAGPETALPFLFYVPNGEVNERVFGKGEQDCGVPD